MCDKQHPSLAALPPSVTILQQNHHLLFLWTQQYNCNYQSCSKRMQKDKSNRLLGDVLNNIDDYRKPYELPHLWKLRKEFLTIYAEKFDIDRLICLSNLFVNINCLGLEYPDEVMKLIRELGSKVQALETYKHQLEAVQEDEEPELPRKQPRNNNNNNDNRSY